MHTHEYTHEKIIEGWKGMWGSNQGKLKERQEYNFPPYKKTRATQKYQGTE